MDWTDDGIVLSAKKHGETSSIVSLLTRNHGRHLGLVRGGTGKKQKNPWRTATRQPDRSPMAGAIGRTPGDIQLRNEGGLHGDRFAGPFEIGRAQFRLRHHRRGAGGTRTASTRIRGPAGANRIVATRWLALGLCKMGTWPIGRDRLRTRPQFLCRYWPERPISLCITKIRARGVTSGGGAL